MTATQSTEAAEATPPVTLRSIFPPRIGAPWFAQGGIYLGIVRGVDGKPDYHLITPANDEADLDDLEWGGYRVDVPAAKCRRDGLANTAALLAMGDATHPAALAVSKLEINGFTDYYLGSQAEMAILVANAPELLRKDEIYWTSTQYSSDLAWVQVSDGTTGLYDKNFKFRARAFRRLLIE